MANNASRPIFAAAKPDDNLQVRARCQIHQERGDVAEKSVVSMTTPLLYLRRFLQQYSHPDSINRAALHFVVEFMICVRSLRQTLLFSEV